mgnify:CR=1 FL=1
MIHVSALHHVTIGCAPEDLPRLLAFYTTTIGLQQGYRPALRHPGYGWERNAGYGTPEHLAAMRSLGLTVTEIAP